MEREEENKAIERIRKLAKEVLGQLERLESPSIPLPVRSLSNIHFDQERGLIQIGDKISRRHYLNVAHTKKFMQTLLVASECKKIIDQGVTTSIRDLYYALKHTIEDTKENTFDDQNDSDTVLEDLESALNLLREELHLKADRKGYMAGNIVLEDTGDRINCAKMGSSGWAIPSNVEPEVIKFVENRAEMVIVIEKDAIWQRLNEDRFWKKHNCIILTGKGQPARGCRRLINRLHKELGLPVYVVTDADSWGFYIYSVIKQGSINLSFLSDRLGTPSAKFIGLTTQDVRTFDIPGNVTIKLNKGDVKRTKELMKYLWFKSAEWQKELKNMLKVGYKLELEALSAKGIRFISEKYLPEKIKNRDFLP